MTWAAIGLAFAILGALTTLALLLHSAHKGEKAATDLAMGEQRERVKAQDDLRLANLTIKAKDGEIDILKDRLAAAEKQRNEAMSDARDHFVKLLEESNVADAAALVRDLVAVDLRSNVLPQQTGRRLSDSPGTELLDPNADM